MNENEIEYLVKALEHYLKFKIKGDPKYGGRVTKDFIYSEEILSYLNNLSKEIKIENDDEISKQVFARLESLFYEDIHYGDDETEIIIGGLSSKFKHEEWNPLTSVGPRWIKHREYLITQFRAKGLKSPVNIIDKHTDNILKLMEDPKRPSKFNSRGLVLGYIQSGKTANFSALISKSADAGYKLVIVLSGIHEILRNQTQKRLGKEIIGYSLEGNHIVYTQEDSFIKWTCLTKTTVPDSLGDFVKPLFSLDNFFERKDTIIAIMKKQSDVLRKFLAWIENSSPSTLSQIPILLIDDEGDQASLDASSSKDSSVSKINGLITEILKKFDKAQYVAYTATPFANILSDMGDKNQLFPKNFIYPLPKQENYFGTEEIFNEDEEKRDLFIVTKDVKEPVVVPKIHESEDSKKDKILQMPPVLTLTDDIRKSIFTFLLSSAIRILRLDKANRDEPMSMIIHIYRINKSQTNIFNEVDAFLKNLRNSTSGYDHEIEESFRDLVESSLKICRNFKLPERETFKYLEVYDCMLNRLLRDIDVIELNSIGKATLDYDIKPNAKIIAIGGDKLSRGLTLEGLSTSHYVRDSKQYDTLLQMGRWFGYKSDYIDLMRVFTTEKIRDNYTKLGKAERDVRNKIKDMIEEELTPYDFQLHINFIKGMSPTGKSKMKHATDTSGGVARTVSSVIIPKLTCTQDMEKNHNSCMRLIERNKNSFKAKDKSWIATKQSGAHILEFISSFITSPEKKKEICEVIKQLNEKRKEWNIAIIGGNGDPYTLPKTEIKIKMPIRTLNGTIDPELAPNFIRIKNISGSSDRTIDDEEIERQNPLLLLYFSQPKELENKPNPPVCLFTCVFPTDSPHLKGYINTGHVVI